MGSAVGYLVDESLGDAAHQRGENDWFRYVEEIFDELGVEAEALPCAALSHLTGLRVLVLGDCDASRLPLDAGALLSRWVEAGGVLIGFGTTGLDDVFGIASAGPKVEAEPYTIGGWMSLDGRDEASGLLDDLLPDTDCPVMSPFRRIAATEAAVLTRIAAPDQMEPHDDRATGSPSPAITRRSVGRGRAYYFAFNLPQAIWTYHQGRPITQDFDGDGYLRTGDAIIVRSGPAASVPCADLVLLILENILAPTGVPFVDRLPPADGAVPDALFHYGGDDEALDGQQVRMSRLMKALGLPYHINVMLARDDRFHFTDEDRAAYEANGHEFSLHLNFVDHPRGVVHPAPVDEAEYDRQVWLFIERYGRVPVCVNDHWCRASGWADLARFGAQRGVRGDNSYVHSTSPPMDPVNLFGAPFGTVYPYFVYDDAEHGNERLDFVNVPIGFYEPGSIAIEPSHPLCGEDPYRPEVFRRIVDLACHYGWTLNVFLHPLHMFKPESRTEDALRCILDHLADTGAHVVHVGTDALCRWWHDRSATRVERGEQDHSYIVDGPHEGGVLVRFLEEALPPGAAFEVNGTPTPVRRKERRGVAWLYILVPPGRHSLRIVKEKA